MSRRLLRLVALLGSLGAGAALWTVAARVQAAPETAGRAAQTRGFQAGPSDHRSIGALAFSPAGVLFFADDAGSAVYGVDLNEKPGPAAGHRPVPNLGELLAARLGTDPKGIQVRDVALSPVSGRLYVSVRKLSGADQNPANPANSALFAVAQDGSVEPIDLAAHPRGRVEIKGEPRFGNRQTGDARIVADLAFAGGRLFASVLSAEQFSSNLTSIPVPFGAGAQERYATSIYHVSHKRQETASPIQTLTAYRDGDREYLMAAYVCTPVVRFNLDDLKPGGVATGITVAELGSGNRPMDMIAYGRPGSQSLLLNNSSFGILKVDAAIALEREAVNEKTAADRGNRGGAPHAGIQPVESLKGAAAYAAAGDQLLVLRPAASGMSLEIAPLP